MKPDEVTRILSLPTQDLDGHALVDKWQARYAKPIGEWRWMPHQAAAFETVQQVGGGFFPMSVGAGKSAMSFFLPDAAGYGDKGLVLTTAKVKREMDKLRRELGRHFYVPDVEVLSYESVSSPRGRQLLLSQDCSFLVLDEAHCLVNDSAARTKRVRAFLAEWAKAHGSAGKTHIVAMSATFLGKTIFNMAHLAEWALGTDNSFMPSAANYTRLEAWSRVLDDFSPGGPPEPRMLKAFEPIVAWAGTAAPGRPFREAARMAFERRMSSTPGVVVYSESSCDARIRGHILREPIPDVDAALGELYATWSLPNGVEVDDPLRMNAKAREISQGGYYYTTFDGQLRDEATLAWDYMRREANAAIQRLTKRGYAGLDSPGLVRQAIARGAGLLVAPSCVDVDVPSAPVDGSECVEATEVWASASDAPSVACASPKKRGGTCKEATLPTVDPPPEWEAWLAVRDDVELAQASDVFSDATAQRAIEWAQAQAEPTIVFYTHRFVADILERLGVPTYRGGETPRQHPVVALSLNAHGTGLNLQWAGAMLFMCPPSNAVAVEQAMGRIHRQGQTRGVVDVAFLAHTDELASAIQTAKADARYAALGMGMNQKILTMEQST